MWSETQRQKNIYRSDVHAGFERTIDQLAMENSVHWHGHVLRREDGHVLTRELDFEDESQRKKGRPRRMW